MFCHAFELLQFNDKLLLHNVQRSFCGQLVSFEAKIEIFPFLLAITSTQMCLDNKKKLISIFSYQITWVFYHLILHNSQLTNSTSHNREIHGSFDLKERHIILQISNLPSLSLSRCSLRLSRQMLSKTFVMLLFPTFWAAAILVFWPRDLKERSILLRFLYMKSRTSLFAVYWCKHTCPHAWSINCN